MNLTQRFTILSLKSKERTARKTLSAPSSFSAVRSLPAMPAGAAVGPVGPAGLADAAPIRVQIARRRCHCKYRFRQNALGRAQPQMCSPYRRPAPSPLSKCRSILSSCVRAFCCRFFRPRKVPQFFGHWTSRAGHSCVFEIFWRSGLPIMSVPRSGSGMERWRRHTPR